MPSRSQDREVPTPPQLADGIPDGADLIGIYKAARTVADVETANASVRYQASRIQAAASDLARLHASSLASCDNVDASRAGAEAAKARKFSDTLGRIEAELTRSVSIMRQRIASEPSASTRARDDLNRFTVAAHEFGRLRLQTQEIAKAVDSLASNFSNRSACLPTEIPPLFAEASAPQNKVVSVARPRPTRRKGKVAAAPKPALIFLRF